MTKVTHNLAIKSDMHLSGDHHRHNRLFQHCRDIVRRRNGISAIRKNPIMIRLGGKIPLTVIPITWCAGRDGAEPEKLPASFPTAKPILPLSYMTTMAI